MPRAAPPVGRIQCLHHHEHTHAIDAPAAFGYRNEGGRHEQAEFGMLPAAQRLDRDDLIRCQIDLRLVENVQLPAIDRAVEVGRDAFVDPGHHTSQPVAETKNNTGAIGRNACNLRAARGDSTKGRRHLRSGYSRPTPPP
jgi:hypothetical protein